MNKVLNCTPHDVVLSLGMTEIKFKKSGKIARIPFTKEVDKLLFGAPINKTVKGDVAFYNSLGDTMPTPDFSEYEYVIVSNFVMEECRGTEYEGLFISPDAFDAIKDVRGQVTAVRGFMV